MKTRFILLVSISLLAALFPCTATESVDVPNVVKERLDGVLVQAASFAEKNSYDSKFIKNPCLVKVVDRNEYQQNVYKFIAKGSYDAEILPDGRLIRFFNDYAFDRGSAGKYENQSQPMWSQEKAIQTAKEYLKSVMGEFPQNLGEPQAKFLNQNRWNQKFYQMGRWTVKWPRSDKSGYRFYNSEGIDVNIYESEGPYALYISMYSHFDGVDFEPVKQVEVMSEAIKKAQEITQWEVVRGTFANGKLLPEYAAGHLEIVQPNYFGTGTEIPTRPDLNARLAWIIWFPWVADDDKNSDPKHPRRGVCVWIDAQNKKWLGGDAFAK